ncbi:hypothetical protein M3Y98_01183500 [Aphelenchoides besseyi]|nr:hypothetical protein M3Y98_01183500 [Aphelenchoides besseyi]
MAFRTISALLTIDVLVTTLDFALLLYNKKQIYLYYKRISDTYTLAKSFSLHGAQISNRLIYPFSISHSVSYSTVMLFYIYYLMNASILNAEMEQFWRECINLMRTFNNFLLFVVLCFVHRQQRKIEEWDNNRKKDEAEKYFQQFNRIIS